MLCTKLEGVSRVKSGSLQDAGSRHIPVRTCIACRERGERAELIRLVSIEGSVRVDPSRSLPGRGAWLHPRSRCIETARKRRLFGRHLTLERDIEPTVWVELENYIPAVHGVPLGE